MFNQINVKRRNLLASECGLEDFFYINHNSRTRNKSVSFYWNLGTVRLVNDFLFPPDGHFLSASRSSTVEIGRDLTCGIGTNLITDHNLRVKGKINLFGDLTVKGYLIVDDYISIKGNLSAYSIICLSNVSATGTIHTKGHVLTDILRFSAE